MAGTKAGGEKAAAKNLARDPDFYKKIGLIGGRKGTTGGFARWDYETAEEHHARVSSAGTKGGRISRRTKRVL